MYVLILEKEEGCSKGTWCHLLYQYNTSCPVYSSCRQSKIADIQLWPKNVNHTVWKCHRISVTQILREINFGECRRSKTVIFVIFGVKKCKNASK